MTTRNLKFVILIITALFVTYVFIYPPERGTKNATDGNEICMDYTNSPGTLRTGLVHEMVDIYRNNQLTVIDQIMKDDSHSIWFDLETVKDLSIRLRNRPNKT
jgi:hypothetical protein